MTSITRVNKIQSSVRKKRKERGQARTKGGEMEAEEEDIEAASKYNIILLCFLSHLFFFLIETL